ncbi:carboxymuconolactone decarboxylase family protein [Alcanivorax hongdengensis]|nr:carboxymuconolactone decarboxylase family protein [Alcanivorax hongdengensis]
MDASQDYLQPPGGWLMTQTERLPAPPPARRGVLFRSVSGVARWFGRQELPRVFPVFNINRRLFWPWLLFASQMMPFGRLPAPLREMLILRTGWLCRSRYEWGQHVEIALRVGVTHEQIVALATAPHSLPEPATAVALQACEELCQQQLISETTWQTLSEYFKPRELVEIILLVGHYQMVAGLLINSGVQLEPSIENALDAFNQRAEALAGNPRESLS